MISGMETKSGMENRGGESILLVDDEVQLTLMAKRLLEKSGYRVEEETNSMAALEKFKTNPLRYDIVITDMKMPKLNGANLSRELLKIRPDIPIILCTGFSEEIDSEIAEAIGIRAFVLKPVSRQILIEIIRDILDRKPRRE
jgi:CheY-like chemotaxis protein